ncbi:unnamed protein product [Camellia sinensis]
MNGLHYIPRSSSALPLQSFHAHSRNPSSTITSLAVMKATTDLPRLVSVKAVSSSTSSTEMENADAEEEKSEIYSHNMTEAMGAVLTYKHELGMNYNFIRPDLIVGSCLQTPYDVDKLRSIGVKTIFCLQQDSDLDYLYGNEMHILFKSFTVILRYFGVDITGIREYADTYDDIQHLRAEIRKRQFCAKRRDQVLLKIVEQLDNFSQRLNALERRPTQDKVINTQIIKDKESLIDESKLPQIASRLKKVFTHNSVFQGRIRGPRSKSAQGGEALIHDSEAPQQVPIIIPKEAKVQSNELDATTIVRTQELKPPTTSPEPKGPLKSEVEKLLSEFSNLVPIQSYYEPPPMHNIEHTSGHIQESKLLNLAKYESNLNQYIMSNSVTSHDSIEEKGKVESHDDILFEGQGKNMEAKMADMTGTIRIDFALAHMFWFDGYKLSDGHSLLLSKRLCSPKLDAIKSATADIIKKLGLRKRLVTLTWKGSNCSTVEVSGLDIGWGQRMPLKYDNEQCLWILQRKMLEGRYEYKYIIDGEWTCNSYELVTPANKDGHVNNYVELDIEGGNGSSVTSCRRKIQLPMAAEESFLEIPLGWFTDAQFSFPQKGFCCLFGFRRVFDSDPNSISAALWKRLMSDDPYLTENELLKIRQFLEACTED